MDNELIKYCEAEAQKWLASDVYDAETKAEVKSMLDNEDKTALIDAFYQTLEFGTGGLRGIMGVGNNRMNKYVVGMATQGFANYINKVCPEGKKSVVVGHDCRNNGRMFAETVANIFSANGLQVYLFESLRPTPE
ncbi:MAG: phospho-sugar mutase, partial [Bacteroidaceae bacterium]|nr:phospho-sugar mutase [Bacteroidaceae bacterium]